MNELFEFFCPAHSPLLRIGLLYGLVRTIQNTLSWVISTWRVHIGKDPIA